jgi:hypothetical protein
VIIRNNYLFLLTTNVKTKIQIYYACHIARASVSAKPIKKTTEMCDGSAKAVIPAAGLIKKVLAMPKPPRKL